MRSASLRAFEEYSDPFGRHRPAGGRHYPVALSGELGEGGVASRAMI